MLYHLLCQSGKPLASSVWWRHKHQCRVWLVSSETHHQPVDLSRRKNVHPGQICKHQFNLHGESCCHQLWQKKLLGHINTQRVTLRSPVSPSNADIKPLWTSKAAIEKSSFLSASQSCRMDFGRSQWKTMRMPCSSFFILIADKFLLDFRHRIRTFNHHKIIHLFHRVNLSFFNHAKNKWKQIAPLYGQILLLI